MVFEVVLGMVAWAIYGTPDRPHPVVLRNLCRGIALSGAVVAGVALVTETVLASKALTILWLVAAFIVLAGEYEFGSRRLAWVFFAAFGVLISLALWRVLT